MTLLDSLKPYEAQMSLSRSTRSADALNHLKKCIELQNDQANTYAQECQEQIETNRETIRKLRSEISEARRFIKSARTNECLMRQALCDHHTGSSIFREQEPRDVNEKVDHKLGDLRNKLNKLRHAHRIKRIYLQNLLDTLDETVNDAVFLELEGPMGDTRCLAIENQIHENERKCVDAEKISHVYKYIRDHLFTEGLSSPSALEAVCQLLRRQKEEMSMFQQSETEATRGKETADSKVAKTEIDHYSVQKIRKVEIADFKKITEQEKHEFIALWKAIQAHFAAQESMRLSHMTYHTGSISISSNTELYGTTGPSEYHEEQLELLQNVTGTHTISEVPEAFEKQESTYQYAKSSVNELEVRKAVFLQRLAELNTVRSSQQHRSETEQDALLRMASGDSKGLSLGQWSRLTARSRIAQPLSQLRQLLEHLSSVLVGAGLVEPTPPHNPSETVTHLHALLETTRAGAAALMASLRGADLEQAQLAAAAAADVFLMTRFEHHGQRRHAQLEHNTARDDSGFASTDGDTTGDDAVPSRDEIKRRAHLILMAKQKSGSRGKRR